MCGFSVFQLLFVVGCFVFFSPYRINDNVIKIQIFGFLKGKFVLKILKFHFIAKVTLLSCDVQMS